MARELDLPWRAVLGGGMLLLGLCVSLMAANAVFGVGGAGVARALDDWGADAVDCSVAGLVALRAWHVRQRRRAWVAFAVAVASYAAGTLAWTIWIGHRPQPPIPSVCDVLWLLFYPFSYLGLLALAHRRRRGRLGRGVWLDGVVAAAGLSAVEIVALREPVLTPTPGPVLESSCQLAYSVGDLVLVALTLGILAVGQWRLERIWWSLAIGFLVIAGADSLYIAQVLRGNPTATSLTSFAYVVGIALIGFAAWQPSSEPRARLAGPRATLAMPTACTLAAVAVLQYDHVHRLGSLAFILADVALAAGFLRFGLVVHDIGELTRARQEAGTDHLTSLPNRRALMRTTREIIARARTTDRGVAVMMMDLDGFKEINDTLGHNAGDELLRQIGPRLRSGIRTADVIGRLGGDEFVIVLGGCRDRPAAASVAETALAAMRRPFSISGITLQITGSIGIAMHPDDGLGEQELLSRADAAMYRAKRVRSGYEFFAPGRDSCSPERLSVAAEFARALEHHELELHYQPQGRASSREIVAVEALVRWRGSDGTLVPPSRFLPAAEQAGLSTALTAEVLDASLRQLGIWRRLGLDVHMAVNTTVSDLLDLAFPGRVAVALSRARLSPADLVLEVTESAVLSDPERIAGVLGALSELGVTISLDDFGTGYSSLSHLVSLPVSELKIDRSFVAEVGPGSAGTAVVEAMVGLAHQLGLRVVTEGVETEAACSLLQAMGCDLIQGFLLGRPTPADELTRQLLADVGGRAERPVAAR